MVHVMTNVLSRYPDGFQIGDLYKNKHKADDLCIIEDYTMSYWLVIRVLSDWSKYKVNRIQFARIYEKVS